jgi:hypothetical protein
MRKVIHRPLTDRARKLIIYELQRIKDAGHCPNASLDQSTNMCWADVYPKRDKVIEPAKRAEADKTANYLAEQKRHADEAKRDRIRRVS